MDREVLFARTLEQVRRLAKDQGGYVSEAQVRDAYKEQELSEEQIWCSER